MSAQLTGHASTAVPFDYWSLDCGHIVRVDAGSHLYALSRRTASGRAWRAMVKQRLEVRCPECEA